MELILRNRLTSQAYIPYSVWACHPIHSKNLVYCSGLIFFTIHSCGINALRSHRSRSGLSGTSSSNHFSTHSFLVRPSATNFLLFHIVHQFVDESLNTRSAVYHITSRMSKHFCVSWYILKKFNSSFAIRIWFEIGVLADPIGICFLRVYHYVR